MYCTSFPEINPSCDCPSCISGSISGQHRLIHSFVVLFKPSTLSQPRPYWWSRPEVWWQEVKGHFIQSSQPTRGGTLGGDPAALLLWNGVKCGSAKPTTLKSQRICFTRTYYVFGTLLSPWSTRSPFDMALRHLAVARVIYRSNPSALLSLPSFCGDYSLLFPNTSENLELEKNRCYFLVRFIFNRLLYNCAIFFKIKICILSCTHTHTQTPCLPLHALFLSLMGVLDKIGLLQTTHLYSCWMKEQISDWGPLWKQDLISPLLICRLFPNNIQ